MTPWCQIWNHFHFHQDDNGVTTFTVIIRKAQYVQLAAGFFAEGGQEFSGMMGSMILRWNMMGRGRRSRASSSNIWSVPNLPFYISMLMRMYFRMENLTVHFHQLMVKRLYHFMPLS
jgi:hypothetical protein